MLKNKKAQAKYHKQWKARNPEKVQASEVKRRSTPEHRAYQRQWSKENPEKMRKYSRSQRKKNPEKRKALEHKAHKLARFRHPLRILISNAKSRAKQHGFGFDLRESDFNYFPLFCPIFGVRLQYHNHKAAADSASLDRIHSDLGYVPSNVQIISWRANQLKSDGTAQEHFLIAQHGFPKNSLDI